MENKEVYHLCVSMSTRIGGGGVPLYIKRVTLVNSTLVTHPGDGGRLESGSVGKTAGERWFAFQSCQSGRNEYGFTDGSRAAWPKLTAGSRCKP